MEQLFRPVDVIALWGADGKIRPLRLQVQSDSGKQRMDVLQILQEKQETRYGWEGIRFLCVVKAGHIQSLVTLFYSQRHRCWSLGNGAA